ncbi:MAG TPA: hypothetical protein VEH27_19200 [Methylomirabilota bacterium]|nr:hypothetical protein [Methylomirabilota bacterium]
MNCALEMAYLLGEWPYSKALWTIIAEASRSAPPALKETLTIAIFEPLPEPPRDERLLKLFWRLYRTAGLEWTVRDAYRHQPAGRFESDLQTFFSGAEDQDLWTP